MKTYFLELIERHPACGYIGALVPTSAGFWVWVEAATKLGALLSIGIGVLVGITTYRVQRLNLEEKKRRHGEGRD